MSKHPKTDMYRRDRDSGMTYRQIAAKYGVSYQCVADTGATTGVRSFARTARKLLN